MTQPGSVGVAAKLAMLPDNQKLTPPSSAAAGSAAQSSAQPPSTPSARTRAVRSRALRVDRITSATATGWPIRIGRSHRDQRILFHAGLELRDHSQNRPEYPRVGDDLSRVLARVRVEIEEQRHAELERGRHHRVLLVEMHLEVAPLHRLQAIGAKHEDPFAPRLVALATEQRGLIDAVDRPIVRQLRSEQRGDRREEVDRVHDLVAHAARRHLAGPADHERHANAPFPRREILPRHGPAQPSHGWTNSGPLSLAKITIVSLPRPRRSTASSICPTL